jgi:PTS system nitrogen regulatory IIA component
MHLGATLRLLRVDAGVSLRDMARRIGVSSAYLSRVENGVDAPPTPERLAAIARELDVPPALLMDVTQRVSPYVAGYLEEVPGAGTLFLEIARRRLSGAQLARVRAFLDSEFPMRGARGEEPVPPLASLLAPERVVVQLSCAGWDDVLDVVAWARRCRAWMRRGWWSSYGGATRSPRARWAAGWRCRTPLCPGPPRWRPW